MHPSKCLQENRNATERGGDYPDGKNPERGVIFGGLDAWATGNNDPVSLMRKTVSSFFRLVSCLT
jgi:hypothetical protein